MALEEAKQSFWKTLLEPKALVLVIATRRPAARPAAAAHRTDRVPQATGHDMRRSVGKNQTCGA